MGGFSWGGVGEDVDAFDRLKQCRNKLRFVILKFERIHEISQFFEFIV